MLRREMARPASPIPLPHRCSVPALAALALLLAACGSAPAGTPRPQASPAADAAAAGGDWMVWPRRLAPGDTIAFVAPASGLDRERMALARQRLEERGYRVVESANLYESEGYLAGSDERRAEELMDAFRDPQVAAIFAGNGGYGTMRLLERLDYAFIRAHPKLVVGFSDLTALHAALNRRAGLVTLHGPTAMSGLGRREGMDPVAERWFFHAVERPAEVPWVIDAAELASAAVETALSASGAAADAEEPPAALGSWGRGKARGRLVGGNLSLVSALEGTPYAIDLRDAILLVEDVREAPYRIDRMLRQLQLAGKLAGLRGAILGQFTRNYDREDEAPRDDPRWTVDGVLRQYFADAGIPVLVSFPIGHVPRNLTLPLGGQVEIDADRLTLTVLERAASRWWVDDEARDSGER